MLMKNTIQNQKTRTIQIADDISIVLGICSVVIGLVSLQIFHFLAIFTFISSIIGLIKTNEVIRIGHRNVAALTCGILGLLISIVSIVMDQM
jgi:hypothetical protein